MKKLTLLIVLICLAPSISAQNAFGIKAGVNFASQRILVSDDWEKSLYPLLSASVYKQIEFSEHTNIILEFGLLQTGFKHKSKVEDISLTTETYVNRFVFSPGVNFKISEKYSLGLGSYFSYGKDRVSKSTLLSDGIFGDYVSTKLTTKLIGGEEFDYGMNFSINRLFKNSFFVSGSYSFGFKNLNAHYDDPNVGFRMNRGVLISLGYIIN